MKKKKCKKLEKLSSYVFGCPQKVVPFKRNKKGELVWLKEKQSNNKNTVNKEDIKDNLARN